MRPLAPLFALSAALLLSAPRPSAACFNEVQRTTDPRATALVFAESRLTYAADPEGAGREVLKLFPRIRGASVEPTERDALVARGARVLAVAIVRTEGKKSFGEATTWTPAANLAWAEVTLREVMLWKQRSEAAHAAAARPPRAETPEIEAELCEALALSARTESEAKRRLEALAKRDLLGSAPAWRTLARLRASAGETAASEEALETCKKRAPTTYSCTLYLPPARL